MSLAGDLEKLTSIIIERAKDEAKNIIAKAREKGEEIVKSAVEEAKRKAEMEALEIMRRRREEALNRRRSEIAKARADAYRRLLDHKERLIEKVVEETKKRLQEIVESKEYERALVEMLKEAVKVLGGGAIEVKLNKRDAKLGLNLADIAKEIARELGEPVELRLASEPGDFMGGLVAKSLKVEIEVDYTIEGILERKWRKLRSEIAKMLFSED
ncbi:MAG: V-type ATP synthase subunit E family protein [Candidatus Nezhaarchaeota archaeon]|nr:V-type ATP synthase subunit E family protein [Candidatus Nezhaarchaeota archaeon]